jgi:hypothetical protein
VGDALSLDHETVAAQTATVVADTPRSQWLARRKRGWGASEVPALLLAYSTRDDEWRTAYKKHQHLAEHGRHGVPRVIARKAGLAAHDRPTGGGEREAELIRRWGDESALVVRTAVDMDIGELFPLHDPECVRLLCTPDGWCRGPSDELMSVEAKCLPGNPPAECPWFWRAQVQSQLAVQGLDAGFLVCGPGWVLGSNEQPISWLIERDEQEIARIRDVCVRAWADVERVRQ